MNTLYPHQRVGADWLRWHPEGHAYLADEMGVGKSATAITAAVLRGARRVCAIAPASILDNLRAEWDLWGRGELDVFSYADPRLADVDGKRYDIVLLDEAHYCKNPKARRTLVALRVAARAGACYPMSGTPAPNHSGELYPVIAALWPRVCRELGVKNYRGWVRRFCVTRMTPWGPKIVGGKNHAELRPYLRQIMLRRTLADVAPDLPPLRVTLQRLPRDARLAAALGDDARDVEAALRREEALPEDDASVSRLRRVLGAYKAPLIGQLLAAELDDGAYNKIVVGAHHRDTLAVLHKALAPFGVEYMDGATPVSERQKTVDRFQCGTPRVMLAQMTVGGLGLNMHAAHELVVVEPDWSPGVNVQFIKRIHRIVSGAPCRARLFAVAGTLDEGIMQVLERKIRDRLKLGLD